jgi:hypothetical protein
VIVVRHHQQLPIRRQRAWVGVDMAAHMHMSGGRRSTVGPVSKSIVDRLQPQQLQQHGASLATAAWVEPRQRHGVTATAACAAQARSSERCQSLQFCNAGKAAQSPATACAGTATVYMVHT